LSFIDRTFVPLGRALYECASTAQLELEGECAPLPTTEPTAAVAAAAVAVGPVMGLRLTLRFLYPYSDADARNVVGSNAVGELAEALQLPIESLTLSSMYADTTTDKLMLDVDLVSSDMYGELEGFKLMVRSGSPRVFNQKVRFPMLPCLNTHALLSILTLQSSPAGIVLHRQDLRASWSRAVRMREHRSAGAGGGVCGGCVVSEHNLYHRRVGRRWRAAADLLYHLHLLLHQAQAER
jgi:hypothetical protein